MGEVGSARYEPALLPPCPSIRVLSYSNCQEIHSRQQTGLAVQVLIFPKSLCGYLWVFKISGTKECPWFDCSHSLKLLIIEFGVFVNTGSNANFATLFCKNYFFTRLTLCSILNTSSSVVDNNTIVSEFWSHTILQKSSTVLAIGCCVTMYSRFLL